MYLDTSFNNDHQVTRPICFSNSHRGDALIREIYIHESAMQWFILDPWAYQRPVQITQNSAVGNRRDKNKIIMAIMCIMGGTS